MKLSDKAIVVTGGAQGLGRACAERFIADGAEVLITDINAEALAATAAEIGAHHIAADISKRSEIEKVVQTCVDHFGKINVILNNAGVAKNQEFMDISDDDYDSVLNVNLKGTFMGVQTAAKQMIQQGSGGVIINMSSINALLANPSLATYAMSKGGMNQLTNVAAVALAPHNIRVVGIGPGTILTEMVKEAIFTSDEARNTVLSRTPAGRCGEPSEVASVAAFLASDDASYITGQTIYPDGGRLVLNYTVPVDEGQNN
ncbi:MAG: SDR family oxidoreductase [Gammaproteobacteria bacterium]|nr:SDR family oxidoreductase [Gammaproteobacteria bacterium]